MYKGTCEGNLDEIEFVKCFNSNRNIFKEYLSKFEQNENLWMVRVTTKQVSKLSGKKVFTRSDCYLAEIGVNIENLLFKNNYCLSEEILEGANIPYRKIPFSGISIKMATSKTFQILKTGSNSFNALFNSRELGAGASLFCDRECELEKNLDLISGWNSTVDKMQEYFSEFSLQNPKFYLNKEICKKIKKYSCQKIKEMIEASEDLQQKIFNGIGLYEEPYTAHYFYYGDKIVKLKTIPFVVTTGSGRSRGDYTIVLKPHNK